MNDVQENRPLEARPDHAKQHQVSLLNDQKKHVESRNVVCVNKMLGS